MDNNLWSEFSVNVFNLFEDSIIVPVFSCRFISGAAQQYSNINVSFFFLAPMIAFKGGMGDNFSRST